jgi:hypothetical protein
MMEAPISNIWPKIPLPFAGVLLLAAASASCAEAGFRSPESLVRNVYAYYGDRSSELSSGLPHDHETARQFFVTMNFILRNSPDGWVIYDVESPHDSLRAFLTQYKN